MEGVRIFKKNPINVAHLPTLMLAIGYPLYWSQMLDGSAQTGITSPAATVLWVAFALFVLVRERRSIAEGILEHGQWFVRQTREMRVWILVIIGLCAAVMAIAFYASTFPIHLMQEGDALNYHYSLTRQHLIRASFAHIPWSGFDLFLLPVDYALAPFWFVTEFPNKFPQFIFLAGLILVLLNLVRYLKGSLTVSGLLAVAFFLGSHGHGIQFGTAMLDLVNCYLFFAMIDSLLKRAHWLFIIEASFYFWSKPFVPVQTGLVAVALVAVVLILKRFGFKELYLDFQKKIDLGFFKDTAVFLKRCVFGFILMSAVVAGPFVAKSLYYAGTPLFPFVPGLTGQQKIHPDSAAWFSLTAMSDYCLNAVRNGYGYGRSPKDFLAHFWRIAVPTDGVNNVFDYPLGLTYLVVLGPFVFLMVRSFKERKIALVPWLVVIFWMVWFAGSQQTRWLYIPVGWMFIVVAAHIVKPSRILLGVVVIALGLNVLSLFRAYRSDFKKSRQDVLREKDKALRDSFDRYVREKEQGYVVLEDAEVAFARFPVMIHKESIPDVIAH